MDVRVGNSDAAGIGNYPLGIEYFLQRLGKAADLHKHEADVRLLHIPDPAVMFLRNKLRVSGIERIAIEEPEVLPSAVENSISSTR